MGQTESKESEQNPNQAAQHARRNTVHGTERSRRVTPPLANTVVQRQTETRAKHTPATPGAQAQQRPAITPRTFPRARPLPIVRSRLTPSAAEGLAQQRQATPAVRTSRRVQQQFAIRPAQAAGPSVSSPNIPTPPRSLPIPISQPSSRSQPERPVRPRGRPTSRRSAPRTKAAVPAPDSDPEATGPPAKRVTRSRAALPGVENVATEPAAADDAATAGPSAAEDRPRDTRPAADEPAKIGDVEPDAADDDDEKMPAESGSDGSDDESDDAASDSDEDPDELDEDSYEADEKSDASDEKSDASDERSDASDEKSDPSGVSDEDEDFVARPASPASPAASAGALFELRRSRRRSVPVRHLQVDPHRVSYISV